MDKEQKQEILDSLQKAQNLLDRNRSELAVGWLIEVSQSLLALVDKQQAEITELWRKIRMD